jgi:hypothetical protein
MEQPGRRESKHVEHVEFLAEQDGVPERELKAGLRRVLQDGSAKRAYLAVVRYSDDPACHVALCIVPGLNADVGSLVRQCHDVFASIFRTNVHLDIIPVNTTQEISLKQVCSPFFVIDVDAEDTE